MAKSQSELEAVAKVYQVVAVETKVDNLTKMVEEVLQNTKGVATVSYVSSLVEKVESEIKEYVDLEIQSAKEVINAKYEPMQKEHDWVKYTLIGGIVLQIIVGYLLYSIKNGG